MLRRSVRTGQLLIPRSAGSQVLAPFDRSVDLLGMKELVFSTLSWHRRGAGSAKRVGMNCATNLLIVSQKYKLAFFPKPKKETEDKETGKHSKWKTLI